MNVKWIGLVLLLIAPFGARGGPILPTSPSHDVAIVPASASNLPQFDRAIVAKFHPNAFIVANQSEKSIVAIVIKWTFVDAQGKQSAYDQRMDSFLIQPSRPVAAPHTRLLIAPGAILPEALANAPHVGPRLEDLDGHTKPRMLSGSGINAQIDVLIFDDGEVVGANQSRYDAEIQDRQIAAAQVAKQVRNAIARGDSTKDVLSSVLATSPSHSDNVGKWAHLYAQRLQKAPNLEAELKSFEALPEPPKFYRK